MKWRFGFLLTLFLCLASGSLQAQTGGGEVALMGLDGNLYRYDVAADSLTAVTTDATPTQNYTYPVWSPNGHLAFFGFSDDPANPYRLGIFIQRPGGLPETVYTSSEEIFTYAYWSPCCDDLALLYTTQDGLATRLVRVGDDFELIEISAGGPFYWDWSPTQQTMAWARFGQSFELYDAATGEIVPLPYTQGSAQAAVDWSPVDDRLLLCVAGARGTSNLLILDGTQEQLIAENIEVGMAFEWSPTAEQVAYLEWGRGVLNLYAVGTGQTVAVDTGVIAFFWSPDGAKLAYLTLDNSAPQPGAKVMQQDIRLRWNVYEVATGITKLYKAFTPTDDMIYYLNFFDQFSRSHRLWSPDSRYLVHGELLSNGAAVTLVDTVQTNTRQIAEGTLGIFSWY